MDIRQTNPGLYYSIMALAGMKVALAVNFWTSNPTFNPYGIPKDLIGGIFFLLGLSPIVFLNWFRDLHKARIGLTVGCSFFVFWAISNTQQGFAGKASFQLPILLLTIAVLHGRLIVELIRLERR